MSKTIIDRYANAVPVWVVDADGNPVGMANNSVAQDRDVNGDPVPTYKPHTFTYDNSGNVVTDTVTDGGNTWVRTYTYQNGQQVSDSGWVKQ